MLMFVFFYFVINKIYANIFVLLHGQQRVTLGLITDCIEKIKKIVR